MSTYRQIIQNGQHATFPEGASFQVLTSTKEVDIDFILDGRVVNRAEQVGASFYYREKKKQGLAFSSVKITANYGTVEIHIDISAAESGTNILSGNVNVTGTVQTSEQTLLDGQAAFTATNTVTSKSMTIYNNSPNKSVLLSEFVASCATAGGTCLIYLTRIHAAHRATIEAYVQGAAGAAAPTLVPTAMQYTSEISQTRWSRTNTNMAALVNTAYGPVTPSSQFLYGDQLSLVVAPETGIISSFKVPVEIEPGGALYFETANTHNFFGSARFFEVE